VTCARVGEELDFGEGFDSIRMRGGDDVIIFAMDREKRNTGRFESISEIF